MVSGTRLMAVVTPVATPAVPRDTTTPAILVTAVDSAFASWRLSIAVYCPRKFPQSFYLPAQINRTW